MLNKKGKSFVTIMLVLACVVLLLRWGVQKIIVYNIEHNQQISQVNLKLLSTALENYAKNNTQYPTNIEQLTKSTPVYLERNYLTASSIRGYEYDCQRLDATGYNCSASPINCQLTGKMMYAVSTGGLIIAQNCDKK